MRGSVPLARRVLSGVGLGLLALGVVATAVYVLRTGDRNSVVQKLAAVLTLALAIAPWLWRWGRPAGTGRLRLADAADQLAKQVRGLWEREAAARRLTTAPIPVRWQWSPWPVTGSVAEAAGGSGAVRFAPLPGMKTVTPRTLRSGGLKDLFGVYGGLGSGRLMILGGPGSGKSGAAILLLLDALRHRASLGTSDERAQVPVPVLLTVHGWDPASQRLTDWIAGRLVRDNEFLRAPEYGPDAPRQLLEGGHVTVILDGLDEMPGELRSVAVRALDTQATFRLVVLTRSQEMVAAVSDAHLRGAAALELCRIDATQAANYLARCQIQPFPQPWHALVTRLGQDSASAVAQALDNPLMLTLTRDIYGSGGQADELLDMARFPTREAVESHLLNQALPAAYAHRPGEPVPPYTAEQAHQWLGYLAKCMDQDGKTRDLAWWQVPRWVPAWPRALAITLALTFVYGIYGLVVALVSAGGSTDVFAGLLGGLRYGLIFGFGLALVSSPACDNTTRIRNAIIAGLVIGIEEGFPEWYADVPGNGFTDGLVLGTQKMLVAWLVVSLGFVIITAHGARVPRRRQRRAWWKRTNLRATVVAGLATGLTVKLIWGLIIGSTEWLLHGRSPGLAYLLSAGLVPGLLFGLAAGLGRRPYQQLGPPPPDRPDTRTILTAVIIGFVMAFYFSLALAFIFLVLVWLGGRPPRQLERRQPNRAGRRTILIPGLVFVLVAVSVFGFNVALSQGLSQGLWFGAAAGLVLGVVFAVLTALAQPSTGAASPIDPQSLWNQERQFGLTAGIGVGLAMGFVTILQNKLERGLLVGLVTGLADFLVIGLGTWLVTSATWAVTLACAQLRHRGGTPRRLLRFLEDARDRQILRAVGPVYQFRHARLQDRLVQLYEDTPPVQKARRSRGV